MRRVILIFLLIAWFALVACHSNAHDSMVIIYLPPEMGGGNETHTGRDVVVTNDGKGRYTVTFTDLKDGHKVTMAGVLSVVVQ